MKNSYPTVAIVLLLFFCFLNQESFAQEKLIPENSNTVQKEKTEKTENNAKTLEECVEYAVINNIETQNKKIDFQIAKKQISEFRSAGLPKVDLNVRGTNNLILQKSIVDLSTFNPAAPKGEEVEIALGLQYTGNANLSFSQMVFSGSFFLGLKAARIYSDLLKIDYERTTVDVREQVTRAYLGALIAKENLLFLKANKTKLDSLLKETTTLYENGFAEKIDVNRVLVNHSNTTAALRKSEVAVQMSLDVLKLKMGMNVEEELILSSDLESVNNLLPIPLFETDFLYNNVANFKYLKQQEKVAETYINVSRFSRLPSLDLFAGYGYNTGTNDFSTYFETNRWLSSANIGLKFVLPIFSGFKISYTTQIRKLELLKIKNQTDYLKKSIDNSIKNKMKEFTALNSNVQDYDKNRILAEEVYSMSVQKFAEGIGRNLEVIEAQTSYREAQTNYFSALYDLLMVKVTLNKLSGNFDTNLKNNE